MKKKYIIYFIIILLIILAFSLILLFSKKINTEILIKQNKQNINERRNNITTIDVTNLEENRNSRT